MQNHNNSNGRTWIGVGLIVIGMLFFLKNFEIQFFNINLFTWPVFFLVVGIIILINHKDSFFGLVLVIIGANGIAAKYLNVSFRTVFAEYWPIMLIILGVYLILKTFVQKNNDSHDSTLDTIEADEYIADIFSIFKDGTKIIKANKFLGGKITSLFSDLKVDLKDCKIIDGTIELDTLTIFGATKILLPSNMQTIIKTTTIFGGFEDHRSKTSDQSEIKSGTLVVKGLVLFGGGEIIS